MKIRSNLILPLAWGILPSAAFSPLPTGSMLKTSPMILSASKSKRTGAMSRKSKKADDSSSGGFGKQTNDETETAIEIENPPQSIQDAGRIYSRPALYDLAFGYRNYEEEVRFLLDSHEKYSTSSEDSSAKLMNVIELAAGPARHAISALRHFSSKVNSSTAVDISKDMIEYALETADEELGDSGVGGMRDKFQYIEEDMRYIGQTDGHPMKPGAFDSAWILLGSMAHLTTNDDVISCFSSASHLLCQGGTMIIELPHPRETFSMVECTRNGWEVPLEDENGDEYGELKIVWGDDDDAFDPIRQIRDFTVAMDLTISEDMQVNDSDLQSVKEIVPMRLFTYQEIEAMGRIAGFEVAGMYGALSDEVNVNSEDGAFRLVCVLRKIRSPVSV
jgi:SAM-dependent methyltransferase